jgi:hypothetical protein
VAILNVVLRDRTVVPDDLLCQVIGGVMLLQQSAPFILLVRQDPHKYHACAIRVYDCPRFELTEEERNGSIVIRGGQPFIFLGNGHNWITRVAPDKNWIPPENGRVQFQIYQVKVLYTISSETPLTIAPDNDITVKR